jgi:hypothetical protein
VYVSLLTLRGNKQMAKEEICHHANMSNLCPRQCLHRPGCQEAIFPRLSYHTHGRTYPGLGRRGKNTRPLLRSRCHPRIRAACVRSASSAASDVSRRCFFVTLPLTSRRTLLRKPLCSTQISGRNSNPRLIDLEPPDRFGEAAPAGSQSVYPTGLNGTGSR